MKKAGMKVKNIVAIALVTLTSCLTLAGPVRPEARKEKGINESVTIQNLGTNWVISRR